MEYILFSHTKHFLALRRAHDYLTAPKKTSKFKPKNMNKRSKLFTLIMCP